MDIRMFRRKSNNLAIVGGVMILFALWSAVKSLSYLVFQPAYYGDDFATAEGMERVIIYIVVITATVVDIMIHVKIGLGAIAEGRGMGKRRRYLGLAFFIAAVYLLAVFAQLFTLEREATFLSQKVVSLLVDLTSLAAMIQLISCALWIRREKKKADSGKEQSQGVLSCILPDGPRHDVSEKR